MLTNRESGPALVDQSLDAFSEKYRQFFPRVFAFVYARVGDVHKTEDIVSDVFERAFTKADSLRNEDAFPTWLFTIARNSVISYSRKHSRETIVDPDVMGEITPAVGSVEAEVLRKEELRDIARILRDFPQRDQDIISLKFDAELSNQQIADIMGINEPNVRVIIFRALRKLRERITAEQSR